MGIHKQEEPTVCEPMVIPDCFAMGMLPPEDYGNFVRLVFYADRRVGRLTERAIVARIILPRGAPFPTMPLSRN